MRNAMTNGYMRTMPMEGNPAYARPGSTDERLAGFQYGYAFSPSPNATPSAPAPAFSPDMSFGAMDGMQGTQDLAPMPTMADLPPMPAFDTMTPFMPFQPFQSFQPFEPFQGQMQPPAAPRNFMARSAYARPPAAPYGRYRGNSRGYGRDFGRGASMYGQMF